MNEAILDAIIRSREVVREVLEDRGFDTTAIQHELPTDLITKASPSLLNDIELELLRIQVPSKNKDSTQKAHVLYWMGLVRPKLNDKEKFDKLLPEGISPEDQIIILLNEGGETLNDTFHAVASNRWITKKQCISFFEIRSLFSNPKNHILVPPHIRVPPEEVEDLLKKIRVKSKLELPHIRYHIDMQARIIGLVPSEIVKIIRSSPTIGEYIMYRICVP